MRRWAPVAAAAALLLAGRASGYCAVDGLGCGRGHNCAIMRSGTKCWGKNNQGQLGIGTSGAASNRGDDAGEMGANLPFVDLGGRPASISAGAEHACALMEAGTIKCWGDNFYGQLGVGDGADRGTSSAQMGSNLNAVDLGAGLTPTKVVAGDDFNCAIVNGGAVKCWGNGADGQLGYGDVFSRGKAAADMGVNLPSVDLGAGLAAADICAGTAHVCAVLQAGGVKCWGASASGQLGYGDTTARGGAGTMGAALPLVDIGTGLIAKACAAGGDATCVVLSDDRVKCWGKDNYGSLGQGDSKTRGDAPGEMGDAIPVLDLGTSVYAKKVEMGTQHVCVLSTFDRIQCWGANFYGQLGYGDTIDRGDDPGEMGSNLPVTDTGTMWYSDMCVGDTHTCGRQYDGTLKCWGRGTDGRLGSGTFSSIGDQSNEVGAGVPEVDLGNCAPTASPAGQPSAPPSKAPTSPTQQPSRSPSRSPSAPPSRPPQRSPTAAPSAPPSRAPSLPPSRAPSAAPSKSPQRGPTAAPSAPPSRAPSLPPSRSPSAPPSRPPQRSPTAAPSAPPSRAPSLPPSRAPSLPPSRAPSAAPSKSPRRGPTAAPSVRPSASPSASPSSPPSRGPVVAPSASPSRRPTAAPTRPPSARPSSAPIPPPTKAPLPALAPTVPPAKPTAPPTRAPSVPPSAAPSTPPSQHPSTAPSLPPTAAPTARPSVPPTSAPSSPPSRAPTAAPSRAPSGRPSLPPSAPPSAPPSTAPSPRPSGAPTAAPSALPSQAPSRHPTPAPTVSPTSKPTRDPTASPSAPPSRPPSGPPSAPPSRSPSVPPSRSPSGPPSAPPSRSPSAPPSRAPSGAPSVRPSRSPSGLPSARPSRSPSVPPSRSPSVPPSVPPSRSPTSPPTTRPSTLPTTAPTGGPTRGPVPAPSGPPSAVPSRHPSAAPTSEPAQPPSAGPSSPPSPAPTAAPAVAPTLAPSVQPSAPPSPQPTAAPVFPTASPTAAAPPTSGPATPVPETAAEAVAGGTADSAAAASVLAASAPAAAQAGRLTILTQGCRVGSASTSESLPTIFHPTGLEVSGAALPAHAGAVVANIAIVVGIAAVSVGASAAASVVLDKTWWEAQGMLRTPNVAILAATVLLQGPTYAGSKLLRSAESAVDVMLGVLALVLGAYLVMMFLGQGAKSQEDSAYKLDPAAKRGSLTRLWLGPGEWLSLKHARVERWGAVFRAALPGHYRVLAIDFAATQVTLVSAGIGGGGCFACGAMRTLDTVIALVLVGLLLKTKPYARPVRLPLTVVAQLLLATASALLAVNYFAGDCDGDLAHAAASGILLAISGFVMLLAVALDVAGIMRGIQINRRNELRAALECFEELCEPGLDVITKQGLREGLARLWNAYIPEDQFAALFDSVDADGSGGVDLHEFLANEHMFWAIRDKAAGVEFLPPAEELVPLVPIAAGPAVDRPRRRRPRHFRVSGAGVERLNGSYHRTKAARPSFMSTAGNVSIVRAENMWRIEAPAGRGQRSLTRKSSAVSDVTLLYFSNESMQSLDPPAAGWQVGPGGSTPAPTVERVPSLRALDVHNLGPIATSSRSAVKLPGKHSSLRRVHSLSPRRAHREEDWDASFGRSSAQLRVKRRPPTAASLRREQATFASSPGHTPPPDSPSPLLLLRSESESFDWATMSKAAGASGRSRAGLPVLRPTRGHD
eukprot:TRINITY_DN6425_c0_g2_i1.p1 TRINITY_DN6425_c0_g2~~TRINITY_DN6425_c0_g2_i1.p1  ORF type:complete len:1684 (+),score=462.89 TRINITY_DN6425_c0_g2_i1:65-5116(+)